MAHYHHFFRVGITLNYMNLKLRFRFIVILESVFRIKIIFQKKKLNKFWKKFKKLLIVLKNYL